MGRDVPPRAPGPDRRGIERGSTVSIGLAIVDVDCFLTDREVQACASTAKNHAKATQKGRIATFDGPLFRDADLVLA